MMFPVRTGLEVHNFFSFLTGRSFLVIRMLSTVLHSMADSGKQNLQNMRAVEFVEGGGPENMTIGSTAVPALREHEILLRVFATAVNRADIIQRKGHYAPPPGASKILGLEAAGIVESIGPSCSGKWRIGDRVMALLPGGGYAEYVAANEGQLIGIPLEMSFPHAAAIPEVWLTAFQLLNIGQLSTGDTVLIHAGASGVGTAAIQLVTKVFKGVAFCTVGSAEKAKFAESLGASHCFNYNEVDFAEQALNMTNGRGVQVVLDCVGASSWEKNARVLAVDGRWILYGLMGGSKIEGDLLAQILRKRIRIEGTTLRSRTDQYKNELVENFTKRVMPLFLDGTLRPIVDATYPLGRVGDAHAHVEANRNMGKVVLIVQDERRKDIEDHSDL